MYLIQGIVLYDFNSPWQNFEFRADIPPSMSVLFFCEFSANNSQTLIVNQTNIV